MRIVRKITFILFLAIGFSVNAQSPCTAITCQISLDLHTEDTLLVCGASSTILTPARFSCESILWSNGATSNSLIVFSSGWIKATKTLDSCSVTDSVFVLFAEKEDVSLPKKGGSYCQFDTFKAIKPIGQPNFVWTIKDSLTKVVTQSNQDTLSQYFSQPSYFIFSANWVDKCSKSHKFSQQILAYARPTINVYDTVACGNSVVVESSTPYFGGSFLWSNGATTQTTQITSSGKYWLTFNTNGCTITDTFQVTLGKSSSGIINPILKGPSSICIGDTGVFYIPGVTESNQVKWGLNKTGPFFLRDTVRYIPYGSNKSGTYKIYALPTAACEYDGIATLEYRIENVGSKIKDTTNCDITYLSYYLPTGSDSYKWSNGSTSSVGTFFQSGEYFVEAKKGQCIFKDTFEIKIASTVPGLYSSSKRTNIWYFGNNAGIDFNSNPPKPLSSSLLNTREGCATLCDESGNLLLYSDGVKIWNRFNQTISNGLRGSSSSTQSAIIVPHPGNKNLYYVFTTPSTDIKPSSNYTDFSFDIGFGYALIDISGNNGLGSEVERNISVYKYTTEKLVAVTSQDKQKIWIITHISRGREGQSGNNAFALFEINKNGFNPTPRIINVGSVLHGGMPDKNRGQMKVSSDGSKLAVAVGSGGIEIFDFDKENGVISNPKVLVSNDEVGYYGVEFSPNARFLYYTHYLQNSIYQVDLNEPNLAIAFQKKEKFVVKDSLDLFYGLQLAPDGKIYVAQYAGSNKISVFNKPNEKGLAADFQFDSFDLKGGISNLTFPSFIPNYLVPAETVSVEVSDKCSDREIKFATNPSFADTYWNFGNGDLDTGATVFRSFANAGIVSISVETRQNCDQKNAALDWKITKTPTSLRDTINVCGNTKNYVYPENISSIRWYKLNNTTSVGDKKNITITQSGNYLAEVENENCKDTSHLSFYLETPPNLDLELENIHCFEDGALTLNPGNGPKSYTWISENLTDEPLSVNQEGIYSLNVKGDSLCNDTLKVKVMNQCVGIVFFPNAFTPNGDKLNDKFVPFTKFLSKYELSIYNQWGELVFLSEDENLNWDGTYRGLEALEGIYTYVLKYGYTYKNEVISKEQKGFISLMR